jgi:hypothetical protein
MQPHVQQPGQYQTIHSAGYSNQHRISLTEHGMGMHSLPNTSVNLPGQNYLFSHDNKKCLLNLLDANQQAI